MSCRYRIDNNYPCACPGIRKGGGGAKSESPFFWLFNFSEGGYPAQKRDEKMIFWTKKVARYRPRGNSRQALLLLYINDQLVINYRGNSLKFALMVFFLLFNF